MAPRFDYFIIFAEMRTGSNFLEANLNALDGVSCHGEAFNPHFIGYPNRRKLLGVSQSERDSDPAFLLEKIKAPGNLGGFRFFHDHDPRALELALQDPRCAKIILTRNPLDSYVSWKIAQETGQWKLTNVSRRKEAKAVFDETEFTAHMETMQAFQLLLLNRLQKTGQTAFYVGYEDLQSLEVMNGLAAWLGVSSRLEALDQSLKPQNPKPVSDKVANPREMVAAIAGIDRFNLSRTPNFEPRRGAAVPTWSAARHAPLLFMPIRGGPEAEVRSWLAALDGGEPDDLATGMTQKDIRKWKRGHPGHRSFTVLRHPVARAHHVFCTRILSKGPGSFLKIRDTLRGRFGLALPKDEPGEEYTPETHREAFLGFLEFLQANLSGQTPIRVDGAWCTQMQALQGFTEFSPPDHVLREEEWPEAAAELARQLGVVSSPAPDLAAGDEPFALGDIYDEEVEAIVARVYQKDYVMFGFGPWRG